MTKMRAKTTAVRIYDQVNLALWAGLVAFVIFCIVVVVPRLPRSRAEAQAARADAREQENAFYCKRLGFADGSALYGRCMSDLVTFRRAIERELEDESLP